jgi:chromosome partitioning related protein ParA
LALTLTIASTKGGVGKTTLAANLGGLLADLGQRVLLIDADVQPTLSSYYPITLRAEQGLCALISEAATEGVISRTAIARLNLIVSDDPHGRLPNWILHAPDGRVRLKHLLARFARDYDFILLDTPGAIGPLQDSAVLAADLLLSPIPPEILPAREFARGTLQMLERLRPMANLGAPVAPLRALIYRMDRTVDARRIAEELQRELNGPSAGAVTILKTVVPAAVAYREAATARLPVHRWQKYRAGASLCARETMHALVHELFPDLARRERLLAAAATRGARR